MEIDALIVEGDTVAIRNTWYGTQTEEFYGIPPSGKSVAVTSVGIDRVQGGLVTEGWGELDMVGMMQEMGALPVVGPGAVANGGDPTWGRTVSSDGEPGSPDENRQALQGFVAAMATGDSEAIESAVHHAFVDHSPGWGTGDTLTVLQVQQALRAAMPDLRYELDMTCVVSEGNEIAGHSIVRGTHTGSPLYGAEPSGNELVWTHSDFLRIADGKVVERWSATDMLTLFQQAGVFAQPEQPASHPRECSFVPET
jgi:predicted ester cyclase